MRNIMCLVAGVLVAVAADPAVAAVATFDDHFEGCYSSELVVDGIRFYDLDQRIDLPQYIFGIDAVEDSPVGDYPDYFSPPNVLGFGGYSEGPAIAYGRCGEFKFTIDALATEARAEFFWGANTWGNTVRMEAIRDGEVVATDHFTMPNLLTGHFTLSVSGVVFDTIRINGTGANQGVFFGVVDNVYVDYVVAAEPTTWSGVKALFSN